MLCPNFKGTYLKWTFLNSHCALHRCLPSLLGSIVRNSNDMLLFENIFVYALNILPYQYNENLNSYKSTTSYNVRDEFK